MFSSYYSAAEQRVIVRWTASCTSIADQTEGEK